MVFEISVFLANKVSHLEQVAAILKAEEINIRTLNLSKIEHGWGVLNLLVDQPEKAYQVLTEAGHSVVMNEVIALPMEDKAGGFEELLMRISRAGIHFDGASTRLLADRNKAVLILEVPDVLEAKQQLAQNGIPVLNAEEVYR